MARKQFVSSMKNAPSRAVSSKEAALQGRSGVDEGGDDSSLANSPESSQSSSMESSEDEDEDGDEANVVAVEVMPSSVGRGKQLRFPTAISRGKESRIGLDGRPAAGSDSDEGLMSVSSEEEDDDKPGPDSDGEAPGTGSPGAESSPERVRSPQAPESPYPIKGHRARKRHRPDSQYFMHMSTYVRDCLLTSARRPDDLSDVFREENHREFRRKLENGEVDRVVWRELPPEPQQDEQSSTEKKSSASKSKKDKKERRSKREEGSKEKKSKSVKSSGSSSSTAAMNKSSKSQPAAKENVSAHNESLGAEISALTDGARSKDTLCAKCLKAVKDVELDDKNIQVCLEEPKPKITEAPKVEDVRPKPPPPGSFTIPMVGGKNIEALKNEASKLNKEARAVKHEGDHKGSVEGQVFKGKCYLRSGAKFFQHALKLADVKAAYKELGDNQQARTFGDYSITTLAQTTSLIESTIRIFQSAGNTRLVAIGCKLASIVHLTIYRLQHLKLFSLYSDLFTPGRSPDSRQNGTTPPIAAGSNDSKEAAIRNLLLKEMEHTLRGFEMWRRYEACKVDVLPRITNPATADLNVLFEDLNAEIDRC